MMSLVATAFRSVNWGRNCHSLPNSYQTVNDVTCTHSTKHIDPLKVKLNLSYTVGVYFI